MAPAPDSAFQPGQRLGAWSLRRPLGRGGMGEVWLAERADGLYQGQAAIKLLRSDVGGLDLAQRFARERALLGRLHHPGIAQLLDAGIDTELGAYLVLEHVQGDDLGRHVRRLRLPVADRVRLLITVARAVEAAHAQLVVHRDLKPGNVLVTPDGHTKLLDFGIASLLDDSGAPAAQLTQLAGRRMTPAYAAPEQIAGEPVGTGADVYALGVIGFELFTGLLPHGQDLSTRTQVEHAVLHGELPRMAALRAVPEREAGPGRPPDAARAYGDLEAVCAKALRKAPAERYASVSAFIDDLQRWQQAQPVSVRREDWQHRTRLWLRRNRALALGGSLVVLALAGGLAASLWQHQRAQQAAREAELVSAYLTELLSAASPDLHGGRQPTVLQLLDRQRATLRQRLADEPAVRDRVSATLVDTYHALNRFDVAVALAQDRLDDNRQQWGADDPRTQDATVELARIHTALGSPAPVVALLTPLRPTLVQRHGEHSPEVTSVDYQLTVALARLGRFDEAERTLAHARAAQPKLYRPTDFEFVFFGQYEQVLRSLQGRWQEAERLLLDMQKRSQPVPAPFQRFGFVLDRSLATVQWRLLRDDGPAAVARAEALLDRIHAFTGPGSELALGLRQSLAQHLQQLGDFDGALAQWQAIEAEAQGAGVGHPLARVPRQIGRLEAEVLAADGAQARHLAEAEALLTELLATPALAGPRRAEALLSLARVAQAPGAQAPALQQRLAQALSDPSLSVARLPGVRARIASVQAQHQGDPAAQRRAAEAAMAHLDGLPEPQGMAGWAARLQVACATPDAPAAWAHAAAGRPPGLPPHPLDGVQPGRPCPWRF